MVLYLSALDILIKTIYCYTQLLCLVSYYFVVVTVLAGIWIASLKRETSQKTDKRLQKFKEVCSNIRSTKMYVWEKYVKNKISLARK